MYPISITDDGVLSHNGKRIRLRSRPAELARILLATPGLTCKQMNARLQRPLTYTNGISNTMVRLRLSLNYINVEIGRSEVGGGYELRSTIETVDKKVAALETRIAELEDALGAGINFITEFPLSPIEADVLALLYKRAFASREQIATRMKNGCERGDKDIDVYICRLRKKLSPHNIKIETRWGEGFYITREMKERLRKFIIADESPSNIEWAA
jgi:two-component system cell cycle response regulator CtrA